MARELSSSDAYADAKKLIPLHIRLPLTTVYFLRIA